MKVRSQIIRRCVVLPRALRPVFLLLLLCCLLGCDQRRLQVEREQIRKGMTKEDIRQLFGGTGRLIENPDRWVCPKGHAWGVGPPVSPSPGSIPRCPTCDLAGQKKPDSWVLHARRRTYLGMPYLYITFDSSGRVDSVAASDM